MPSPSIDQRIKDGFEDMSPKLRIAARYIAQCPDDVALCSMRTLAAKAEVTPTTMLRLAKHLGFADYNSFRDEFRDRLREQVNGGPFATRARQLQAQQQGGGTPGLVNDVLALEMTNLQSTFANLEPEIVDACVVAIERAQRVFVIGRRSCYPVAYGLYYAYQMFRRNGHLVDERGGNFGSDFATIGSADVLIGISFDPYSREVVTTMRHAAQRGTTILAITDNLLSPIARLATYTLPVANASQSFFQSITAATTLAQTLVASLLARGGEQAVQELEANEAHLRRLGAYWDDYNQGRSV